MIRITVHYDPASRTFKLLDLNFDTLAEGDALLDMKLPMVGEESDLIEDFRTAGNTFIAHA